MGMIGARIVARIIQVCFLLRRGFVGVAGVADVASGSLRGLSREKIANGE
jgi:hypothetical protein